MIRLKERMKDENERIIEKEREQQSENKRNEKEGQDKNIGRK